MLLRVVRVSGWSGPRTRSRSGSSSWNSRSASAGCPHCPVQDAMLLRVVRVSGWSGPRTRSWSGSSSWNSRSASAGCPHSPVQDAMLLRVVRVSGWSGPRTRSRSGSSSWNSRSASAGSPHSPGPGGDVAAGGQGVGMVRAQDPLLVGQQLLEQPQRLRRMPALARSRTRCCCGWPGCRGGRARGPAPGRAAAPGTAAAPLPDARSARSRRRCRAGWSGCRGGRRLVCGDVAGVPAGRGGGRGGSRLGGHSRPPEHDVRAAGHRQHPAATPPALLQGRRSAIGCPPLARRPRTALLARHPHPQGNRTRRASGQGAAG